MRGLEEVDALFYTVDEGDVAIGVGAVDEGEFDSGAGVAAVEDYEEGAAWRETRDQVLVEGVGVELAVFLKVDGDDGVVVAGVAVTVGVPDLAAVAGVVEEVAGVGFGDKPLYERRRACQR